MGDGKYKHLLQPGIICFKTAQEMQRCYTSLSTVTLNGVCQKMSYISQSKVKELQCSRWYQRLTFCFLWGCLAHQWCVSNSSWAHTHSHFVAFKDCAVKLQHPFLLTKRPQWWTPKIHSEKMFYTFSNVIQQWDSQTSLFTYPNLPCFGCQS